MGNYNAQYQSYYNSLGKKQKDRSNFTRDNNKNKKPVFFIKILVRQLIGVLILIIFVLACKVVVTPKTQYVYNYSREVISKQYDYDLLMKKAKKIKFKDIEIITGNFLESIRNSISKEYMINDSSYKAKKL